MVIIIIIIASAIIIIISAKEVMFLVALVSLLACLFVGLQADSKSREQSFYEIFTRDVS